MVLTSPIPGTSSPSAPHDTIASIKDAARHKSSPNALRNFSAINLLNSARKMVDSGIMAEDGGDLQDALLKYYTAAGMWKLVMESPEYKQEDAPGKHGAVYQQVFQFGQLFTTKVQPRLSAVELRLQEAESRAAAAAEAPAPVNGATMAKPVPKRLDSEGDGPNERSGGSIMDRMRRLQGAGVDVTTSRATSAATKRFSHQSTASTSSTQPSTSSRHSQPPPPHSAPLNRPLSGEVAPSPRVGTSAVSGQSGKTEASVTPSSSFQGSSIPPTTPLGVMPQTFPTIAGAGSSRSPSASPRIPTTEIRRQGTGGSTMSSSPRHRNLQSISTPAPEPTSSRPTSSSYAASSSLREPETPSVSKFANDFPSIEDLDERFGQLSADPLPSVPENRTPSFPTAPTNQVGRSPRPGPAPSSENLDLLRNMPTSPDFSNTSWSSSRAGPSSPVGKQHTGSSASGLRNQLTGGSNPPSKAPTPLPSIGQTITPGSSSTRYTMTPPQAQKPDIPITTTLFPTILRQYMDTKEIKVLLLDVRQREQFEKEHIDHKNIVCIEPTVLMRHGMDAMGLESSLVVSPRVEEDLFRTRNLFDVIVLYDEASPSLANPILGTLSRFIYDDEFQKRLPRQPKILVGGIRGWKEEFGTKGLTGTDVGRQTDVGRGGPGSQTTKVNGVASSSVSPQGSDPASYRRHAANGHTSISYASSGVNGYVNGNGSSTPQDFNRKYRDAYEDPVEKDQRRRAHVRDGAVFEPETSSTRQVNNENVDSSGHESEDRVTRKSSLYRPSSSGTISAYNRPLPDTVSSGFYAAHVPITYPSRVMAPTNTTSPPTSFPPSSYSPNPQSPVVAPPPQASLSFSPLARRRSDYAEQALFPYSGHTPGTKRASIDYPALSAQNLVRPPPAAASNSMERQEARPRGHTSSMSVSPLKKEDTTYIGGQVYLKPATIPVNYTVHYWSDAQIGMSGLRNLGNTCYMNSIVQCLSATVPFVRFFIDGRWKSAVNMHNPLGKNGAVASAFATMVHDMWQGESTYLSPYGFRKSICTYAPQFSGSDQHDAQEFLSFLLDGLHEDLNRILGKPALPAPTPAREKELETLPQQIASAEEWQLYRLRDDSLVVDYFQGQFRNRLQCSTCQHTSTTYNAFMYLSLPIPTGRNMSKVSLYQCLDAFVRPETMEKGDAWNCPNCKTLRKASKQLSLSRLPPVLLIHLKRFSFKGPFTDKLETMVDFPLKDLDLTNYMPALLPPGIDKGSSPRYSADDPRAQVPPYRYELYAVTNHFGSLSSGHYTSFIASKGGWVYCDDSRLSPADPRDVVGRPAYILFYRRVRAT